METTITTEITKKRQRAILWFRIYLVVMAAGIAGIIITSLNFDNINLGIFFSLLTACALIGCSITFWQRVYYRIKSGKSEAVVEPADNEIAQYSVKQEQAASSKPTQVDEIVKKERKGFGSFVVLLGRSIQWAIMGFLFVTILNIIPVIPRGKRSMGNILIRFFAFAVMFPYALIGLIFMIFIWGNPRNAWSASVNKIIDWYDYDRS